MKNGSRLQQQASEWLAAMHSDQVTDAEREQFMAWLDANPQHSQAYSQADAIWAEVAELEALKEQSPGFGAGVWQGFQALFARPALSLGALSFGALAVAVLATVVLLNPALFNPAPTSQQYSTQRAQMRTIELADGSSLTLGALSRVDVRLSKTERHVALTRGQAFFSVAKESHRPFIVQAGNAQVQVTGTQFDVRHAAKSVHVAVVEGVVQVSAQTDVAGAAPAPPMPQQQTLRAGQKTVALATGELQPVQNVAVAQLAAWRNGRLIYNNSPLGDVIADANRYYSRTIRLAAELNDLTITAVFRTDQIEQMLNNLQVTYAIDIVSIPGGDVVIKPRLKGR